MKRASRRTSVVGVAVGLAACGGGSGPSIPVGTAEVEGTVADMTVDPTTVWFTIHPSVQLPILVMAEGGFECDAANPAPGLAAVIGWPCGAAATGTFMIGTPETSCGTPPHLFGLVEGFDGETSEFGAISGSVTINAITPSIQGSFDLTFENGAGMLTGIFNAVDCRSR